MPVTTRNPQIETMLPQWRQIQDVLAGPRKVKERRVLTVDAAGMATRYSSPYLPRTPGQTVFNGPTGELIDEYANYLFRAVLLPFAGPLVNKLCGLVFKKLPVFTVPPDMEEDLTNLTADGRTAEGFAWDMLRTNVSTGFGVVVTNYSELLARPYERLYPDTSVIDFRFAPLKGSPVLTQVRVCEEVEENSTDEFAPAVVEQYRVLELTRETGRLTPEQRRAVTPDRYPLGYHRHRLFRRARDAEGKRTGDFVELPASEQPPVPTRAGQPLSFLPVVPMNPVGPIWEIATPPLSYLCELILAAFRNSADYEELLHACGAGTILHGWGFPKASPDERVERVGGGSIVTTEQQSGLQYVQTNGASGVEISRAIQEKQTQMGIAVGRLLLSQQKNVAESGASLDLQFSGDDASLQVVAGATAMALEQALKNHRWWESTLPTPEDVDDVRVEFNDQFIVSQLQAADLVSLVTARDMGALTDRDLFWNLQQGQRLDPNTTFESWEAGGAAGGSPTDRGAPGDVVPPDGGVNIDAIQQNADWPKRTPDQFDQLPQ